MAFLGQLVALICVIFVRSLLFEERYTILSCVCRQCLAIKCFVPFLNYALYAVFEIEFGSTRNVLELLDLVQHFINV